MNLYRKTISVSIGLLALAPWVARGQAPFYTISTVVGNGTSGYSGDGGPATQAELANPCQIAVDSNGNLYIADELNVRIREVSGGTINTIAGTGTSGYTGDTGAAISADISSPCGVAISSSGTLYFSQTSAIDSAVRSVSSGTINTVTGTSLGAGWSGDGYLAVDAQVNGPTGLTVDNAGNLYIADTLNNRIRKIDPAGYIITYAGNGTGQYSGDGGLAWLASVNAPTGIATDSAGNVYIADTQNHCIRKVSGNIISTFAGVCSFTGGYAGDGGPATKALLYYPRDVAVDAAGNVYIADTYNFRIRMVNTSGTIYTIAGKSHSGYTGDGGLGTDAELNFPSYIALGPNGVIYIADTDNNVIRMLTPGNTTGPYVPPPTISSIVSASACGDFSAAAPGSWIEIYGSSLAADKRSWASSDFNGINAPLSLDGTQVSIGGQSAVVSYISPTQVNVQVPLTVSPGTLPVILTAPNGTSPPIGLTVNAAEPGLCFAFTISGTQYATAVIAGTSTYILPASANFGGISFQPAKPGETISLFGNGFGPVSPPATQGQLVQGTDQLTMPLEVFFGQTQAQVTYAGFAPGYIGLYQINVVVPNIPNSDQVPITFALGNFAAAPTLYTSVQQ